MKTAILVPLVVLGLLVPARPVPAAMMAYLYSGQVTSVADPYHLLDGSIVQGTPFTGRYIFESTMTDENPDDPRWGIYTTPGLSIMTTTVGNYTFTSAGDEIAVGDSVPKDQLNLRAYDFEYQGLWVRYMGIYMFDYYGEAFSSDALPVTHESLLGLAGGSFSLDGSYVGGDEQDVYYYLSGQITSFQVVPEPTTLVLLTVWLLVFRRDCRLRSTPRPRRPG